MIFKRCCTSHLQIFNISQLAMFLKSISRNKRVKKITQICGEKDTVGNPNSPSFLTKSIPRFHLRRVASLRFEKSSRSCNTQGIEKSLKFRGGNYENRVSVKLTRHVLLIHNKIINNILFRLTHKCRTFLNLFMEL